MLARKAFSTVALITILADHTASAPKNVLAITSDPSSAQIMVAKYTWIFSEERLPWASPVAKQLLASGNYWRIDIAPHGNDANVHQQST